MALFTSDSCSCACNKGIPLCLDTIIGGNSSTYMYPEKDSGSK